MKKTVKRIKINKVVIIFLIGIVMLPLMVVWKLFFSINLNTKTYRDEHILFSYPSDARIVLFQETSSFHVLLKDGGSIELNKVLIQPQAASTEATTDYATRDFSFFNRPPKKIINSNLTAYTLTKHVNNIEFGILMDVAYIESPEGLYRLSLGVIDGSKRNYMVEHQVFELILKTLKIE
jgi:hypothetical protein